MAVKHVYGTQSQYEHERLHSRIIEDALYFIRDTQCIYRGNELIVRMQIKIVDELPKNLEASTVYIVSEKYPGEDRYIQSVYVSDSEGAKATKITDNSGDIDAERAFNQLPKFTSQDVKDGWLDKVQDDKFATGGALKQALTWEVLPS